MPFAISITANNPSAAHIQRLWRRASAFEDTSSMAALNYPPHITFAIYDDIQADRLCQALEHVFSGRPALRLLIDRIGFFEDPAFLLWAAPTETADLLTLHSAIHDQIERFLCRPHYRPGTWVPHCTLAMEVRDDRRDDAVSFAAEPIDPVEVLFDTADCISFPPVQMIKELVLD